MVEMFSSVLLYDYAYYVPKEVITMIFGGQEIIVLKIEFVQNNVICGFYVITIEMYMENLLVCHFDVKHGGKSLYY